jgi:predicted kinase
VTPRLVHLNGPPAVGTSTLARRLADDVPGTLALDADAVVAMVGGWREDFWSTLPVARRLAAVMTQEHLSRGADVVLPQLVTVDEEIAPYLAAAEAAGATYVEVVLLADDATTVDRFTSRGTAGADPVARRVAEVVEAGGGRELLAKIRGDLRRYLRGRVPDVVIDTTGRTAEETHRHAAGVLRRGAVGPTG